MKHNNDRSLFAWQEEPSAYNSMIAAAPKCFLRQLSDFLLVEDEEEMPDAADTTYSLTNRGLHISLPLYEVQAIRKKPCAYELEVPEVGMIDVFNPLDELESRHLSIAILRDVSLSTSVVILLERHTDTQQYKRIATEDILAVKRLPQWKDPEAMFIG